MVMGAARRRGSGGGGGGTGGEVTRRSTKVKGGRVRLCFPFRSGHNALNLFYSHLVPLCKVTVFILGHRARQVRSQRPKGHEDEAESLGSPLYGVSLVGSPHAGQRVILLVTEGHSGSRADHRKVTHLEASTPRKISMRVRECACGGRVYVKSLYASVYCDHWCTHTHTEVTEVTRRVTGTPRAAMRSPLTVAAAVMAAETAAAAEW